MGGMATVVIVKIPDRDEEFRIPADEFFVDDDGQLLVLRHADDNDPQVCAQFATYSYVHLEEDEDEDELTHALNVARRHGFVIDDPMGGLGDDLDEEEEDEEDEAEDEDEEDDGSDEEADEDDPDEALRNLVAASNGHAEVVVLVAPVLSPPAEPGSGPFSAEPSPLS